MRYSLEAAAKLLHDATGITEMPENCDGLAACLNAATDGLVKIATGQVLHVYRASAPMLSQDSIPATRTALPAKFFKRSSREHLPRSLRKA